MAKRAGLPQEGGEGEAATETPKKGRGPNKPRAAGLFVELPPDLAAEVKATAERIGNGNAAHTRIVHDDIMASLAADHQEHAKSHQGKIADRYFNALKVRAAQGGTSSSAE